ncbi:MAG: xanthine dehydrogenase YagS FAD-binding subunit [Acidobacteriota bacterium]|jgi:xanthine dehydrogenase YagS FAD-binding subunit|nr:xanthine dehydrogenase YagS FAD-binding subunit [Acidobacteriota bacterium]
MRPFEYASPTMLGQAVSLLASPGSVPLAGGSDLLALMKDDVETPGRLVNLKEIRDLHGIRLDPKAGLKIGALVTIDELAADPALRFDYGALADAAGRVAGPQIRNVATVGGNLCQRPRCWYFRNGFGLLPMLNGKSMVIEGDNRYHSIFSNEGTAAFVSPSTIVPLLVALGTQVTIAGPKGERTVDLESFYRVPQNPGEREHDLGPGEIVTSITVAPVAGRKLASYEVRQRETLDWSLATAAVTLEMDGPRVAKARVVLGQVAPVPWTSKEAEAVLADQVLGRALAQKAGEAAVQGAKPLSRNRYKVQLARVAVQRALLAAAGMGA